MKQKIIFVGYWPDYEAMAIDQADPAKYEVVRFNPDTALGKFFPPKKIPKPLRTRLEKKLIKRCFSKHPDSIFVITDTRLPMEALNEYPGVVSAHVLMRNILDPRTKTGKCVLALQKKHYPVWSFDKADCDKHSFDYYNQYAVRIPGLEDERISYDLTFVGRDKGRSAVLYKFADRLSALGLKCFFDIRSSEKHAENKNISYLEYVRTLCAGRCIVDMVQENQTGMTMRPLEALIYKRKLITNNRLVELESFYHPDNIYVASDIETVDLQDFKAFLDRPSTELPESLLQTYSINGFLGKILSPGRTGIGAK